LSIKRTLTKNFRTCSCELTEAVHAYPTFKIEKGLESWYALFTIALIVYQFSPYLCDDADYSAEVFRSPISGVVVRPDYLLCPLRFHAIKFTLIKEQKIKKLNPQPSLFTLEKATISIG
jgi:hypothetical protein